MTLVPLNRPIGLPALALAVAFAGSLALADDTLAAWKTEPGVDVPSYAVTEPTRSDVNVDSVVLMCEPGGDAPVLQLQLYLTDDGPLLPRGAKADALKGEPRAELAIDGRVFPVGLFFADDHVVVADADRDRVPQLSEALVDALQNGHQLTMRLDLLAEPQGKPPAFDGTLDVELAGKAIAAVRRCASVPALSLATH